MTVGVAIDEARRVVAMALLTRIRSDCCCAKPNHRFFQCQQVSAIFCIAIGPDGRPLRAHTIARMRMRMIRHASSKPASNAAGLDTACFQRTCTFQQSVFDSAGPITTRRIGLACTRSRRGAFEVSMGRDFRAATQPNARTCASLDMRKACVGSHPAGPAQVIKAGMGCAWRGCIDVDFTIRRPRRCALCR